MTLETGNVVRFPELGQRLFLVGPSNEETFVQLYPFFERFEEEKALKCVCFCENPSTFFELRPEVVPEQSLSDAEKRERRALLHGLCDHVFFGSSVRFYV